MPNDEKFMKLAIELARFSLIDGEFPVGAIVVRLGANRGGIFILT